MRVLAEYWTRVLLLAVFVISLQAYEWLSGYRNYLEFYLILISILILVLFPLKCCSHHGIMVLILSLLKC